MTAKPPYKITLRYAAVTALTLLLATTAAAQTPPPLASENAQESLCTPPPAQTITTLQKKAFGVPPLWDATYENGHKGSFHLGDGLPLADGTVLIAGTSYSAEKFNSEGKSASFDNLSITPDNVVIAQINPRGRAIMEKSMPARPFEKITSLTKLDKHYLLVSSHKEETDKPYRLALRWIDNKADTIREKNIADAEFSLAATGVTVMPGDEGFIVFAKAYPAQTPEQMHSKIFAYDKKGSLLWQRSIRPGIPNKIEHLSFIEKTGHYIAAGQIKMDDGRMAGWVMELDENGALLWQQTYPRGAGANILAGAPFADESGFFFAGVSEPLDNGGNAAWLMKVTTKGEPVWQRYLRQEGYDLAATDIDILKDGRITLLHNVKALSPAKGVQTDRGRHYIRAITLSPYGDIIQDEPYIDGIHAEGKNLVTGKNGARILFANIIEKVSVFDEAVTEEQNDPLITKDASNTEELYDRLLGWVIYAKPAVPYDDSCQPAEQDQN